MAQRLIILLFEWITENLFKFSIKSSAQDLEISPTPRVALYHNPEKI